MTELKTKKSGTRRKPARRKKKTTPREPETPASKAGGQLAEPPAPTATQVDVRVVSVDEVATGAGVPVASGETSPPRRRRGGRHGPGSRAKNAASGEVAEGTDRPPGDTALPAGASPAESPPPSAMEASDQPALTPEPFDAPASGAKRSRRPRGGAGRKRKSAPSKQTDAGEPPPTTVAEPSDASPPGEPPLATEARETSDAKPKERTRSRGTRRGRRGGSKAKGEGTDPVASDGEDRAGNRSAQRAPSRKPAEPTSAAPSGKRQMLINVSGDDECRIAVVREGRLEELFIERATSQSHVGNIYKGRVVNLEPSIQAAFVDFGLPSKNGFLHISDVQPQYFPDHKGVLEEVGRKIPRHQRPPIQTCFQNGQEVIVQVTKEGVGTKGPTLTTYLSIPGRFLVMMPGMNRHGVSRKIEDEVERRTMRDLMSELDLPSDMGYILRTAGLGRTKRELQRDLTYLNRLWKIVVDRIKRLAAPAELYQESDLVTRTIRDVYTADFSRVVVDDPETASRAREFLQIAMPRAKVPVDLYSEREPLFHHFHVEAEIERINMREVPLASGGSLVIDSTEALVAIDVNSGRSRVNDDAEETAFQVNIEAAEEIARQLRLRDLGGLIVCDFIDMRQEHHKRAVERALRDALKSHKERFRTSPRLSTFGLMEITRQRQGPSMKRSFYFDCPHCSGTGLVKMADSVVLDVMRIVQLAAHNKNVQKVTVSAAAELAYQLLNSKRAALNRIETETQKQIIIRGDPSFTSDQVEYLCQDARGRPVNAVPSASTGRVRGR